MSRNGNPGNRTSQIKTQPEIVSTRRVHTSTKDRTRLGSSLIFSRWISSESALRSAEVRRRVKREQPQIILARPEDGDPGIVDYAKYAKKLLVSKPQGRRGKDRHRSCGREHRNRRIRIITHEPCPAPLNSLTEGAPRLTLVFIVACRHPCTNDPRIASTGGASSRVRIAPNRVLHLTVVALELRALSDHALRNCAIDRDQAEHIPPLVGRYIGDRDASACHHLASYFGGVTLALHAAGVHRAKLNALFYEVFAEKTSLLAAKLGQHVVVVARSRLCVTDKVDVSHGYFLSSTIFYFLFSIFRNPERKLSDKPLTTIQNKK